MPAKSGSRVMASPLPKRDIFIEGFERTLNFGPWFIRKKNNRDCQCGRWYATKYASDSHLKAVEASDR